MKAFTIHESPEPPVERLDRADSLIFVKDGFSWSAFFFAPLWFLANSLWIALMAYTAIAAALITTVLLLDLDLGLIAIGFAALQLVTGFEADSILRWTLARSGWRELGAVTGRTQDECERSFYGAWLPHQPLIARDQSDTRSLGTRVSEP